MKTRAYRATDYPQLIAWWAGHGWGKVIVPEHHISPTTLVVENEDGESLACIMIYKFEGVPLARLGFVVNNPELEPRDRLAAMTELARATVELLQEMGIEAAFAFYDHPSLCRVFKRAGFLETRSGVPELMWSPNIQESLPVLLNGVE